MQEHSSPEGPSSPQPAPNHCQHWEIWPEGCDCLLGVEAGGCGGEQAAQPVSGWLGLDVALLYLCADTRRLHLSKQTGMIGTNYRKDAIYHVHVCVCNRKWVPGLCESFQWEAVHPLHSHAQNTGHADQAEPLSQLCSPEVLRVPS